MKRFITILGLILLGLFCISAMFFISGSPGAKTGSPLDGNDCSSCHSSTVTTQNWITTDIPQSGYVPGEVYTITANGNHAGVVKFGFEITAENASSKVGEFTITNATETKLINSDLAVTHTSAGTIPNGDEKSWTCEWRAPDAGYGNVAFYAAFNASNGDGSTGGDVIYFSMLEIEESTTYLDELQKEKLIIYPNPVAGEMKIIHSTIINRIELFALSGKRVLSYENINEKEFLLDIKSLSGALYIVKVKCGDKLFIKKIKVD